MHIGDEYFKVGFKKYYGLVGINGYKDQRAPMRNNWDSEDKLNTLFEIYYPLLNNTWISWLPPIRHLSKPYFSLSPHWFLSLTPPPQHHGCAPAALSHPQQWHSCTEKVPEGLRVGRDWASWQSNWEKVRRASTQGSSHFSLFISVISRAGGPCLVCIPCDWCLTQMDTSMPWRCEIPKALGGWV